MTTTGLGIGTTSPESQLTINHGSNTIASETNAVTAASKAALTITGSGGIIGQISMDNNEIHHFGQDLFIQSQGDTSGEGNIKFRTGVSGKSDRMILTGGGNLGIGTFNPTKKLVVAGEISSSGDLTISDGTRELQYDVSAHALKSSGQTLDFNGTDFSFNTNDLFIDQSTSRVGIGTTSPTADLEISSSSNTLLKLKSTDSLA